MTSLIVLCIGHFSTKLKWPYIKQIQFLHGLHIDGDVMCQMSSKLTLRKSLGVLPPLASPEAEQLDRTAGRSEATWHNDGDGNLCDTAKIFCKGAS